MIHAHAVVVRSINSAAAERNKGCQDAAEEYDLRHFATIQNHHMSKRKAT